jgi:hypothetical protein
MKKFKKVLYLVFFSLFLSGCLNAQEVGLLNFKAVGVENNMIEVISELLGSELASYGYTIVSQDIIEENLGRTIECQNKTCAAEIGRTTGLEKVIFGAVTKLGEKYIVSAVVVESQTGEIVFSDKVTSKTTEDLDVCLSRLAKSIVEGKEVEKTIEVGKITEEEVAKEEKRKQAFFSSGGGFGIGIPIMGYGDSSNNVIAYYGDIINYYEFKAWYETPKFAAELDWYFGTSGEMDLSEWSVGISLVYFFTTTDFSPYLSIGMARKSMTMWFSDYTSGLALEAGGGLVIFRTYDFRIVIDGRLSTSFNDIGEMNGPHSVIKIGANLLYKRDKGGGCSGGCIGF